MVERSGLSLPAGSSLHSASGSRALSLRLRRGEDMGRAGERRARAKRLRGVWRRIVEDEAPPTALLAALWSEAEEPPPSSGSRNDGGVGKGRPDGETGEMG